MNTENKNNSRSPNKRDAYYRLIVYGTVTLHVILNRIPIKDSRKVLSVWTGYYLAYWKLDNKLYINLIDGNGEYTIILIS